MAYVIGNIKKFFADHPEFENREKQSLKVAEKMTEANGVTIVAMAAREALCDLYPLFEREVTSNQEHINLFFEAMAKKK